jgi:hypothetical protein
MFWDIFITSTLLIAAIIFVGWLIERSLGGGRS